MASSDAFSLTGKVVVVTAAGIGRAIALAFAEAGGSVACVDLDASTAAATSGSIAKTGARSIAAACDVSRESDAQAAADSALRARLH